MALGFAQHARKPRRCQDVESAKKKSVIGLAREVKNHTAIIIVVFLHVMEDVEQHEARV